MPNSNHEEFVVLFVQCTAELVTVDGSRLPAGAVIQNKAGAGYTQLQEGSNQNKHVTSTGLRGLLVDRPGSFAAAPYLLRR